MVFGQKGAVIAVFLDRSKPQHRQMAHPANAAATITPGYNLRRQTQPSSNAPQVIAGQHDILPPAAAVAAARTGKAELRIPLQQRHGIRTGKIYLSAQVNGFVSHSQTSFSMIECPYCTAGAPGLQGKPCVARLFFIRQFPVHMHCIADVILFCPVVSGRGKRNKDILLSVHGGKAGQT